MSQTLTFEQLEERAKDPAKSWVTPNDVLADLMAHLRVQEMRLTAWEEGHKKLCQRFTSLDEEFYEHVEVNHELLNEVNKTPNPLQFTHEYQKSQGMVVDDADLDELQQQILQAENVTFDDENDQIAFDTAFKSLKALDPEISEGELLGFILG